MTIYIVGAVPTFIGLNAFFYWKRRNRIMIEKIIKKAISFLGVSEPTGDDQFIKLYNELTGAGFSMSVAWCAIFVTVIARLVGAPTSLIPTFASCDAGVKWFKNKGRYEKAKHYGGTYTPKRGDVIFYSSKHTQADSTHVGYVVSVSGDTIKAIEGNKNDAVGYRNINVSDKYIIGYGRVADFAGGTTGNQTSSSETTSNTKMDSAKSFNKSLAGTYTVNTNTDPLMLRAGAGQNETKLASMPKGSKVKCYGYYTTVSGIKWLLIVYNGQTGFASSKYLKK